MEFKGFCSSYCCAISAILIESQWNLKRFNLQWYAHGGVYINRITVEFKDTQISCFGSIFRILIESQWNLKLGKELKSLAKVKILIESQWNLKYAMFVLGQYLYKILIESQWNLKES